MESYAKEITKAAKEVRPEISVSIQCASWRSANHLGFSMEYFNAFDYSAGDFYTDVREQAVDCKFLRSVSKNQPFEYMVPRCPDLTSHTVSKPVRELIKQAYSSFLHVKALDNARVLANACFPFSNHNDSKRFITAISDPPWEETDIPVLVENDCGNGKCIYSSLLLFNKIKSLLINWLDFTYKYV